jgi:hypothetical protein
MYFMYTNKSFNYFVTYCKSKQLFFPSLLKKEQKQTEPAHRLTHHLTAPNKKRHILSLLKSRLMLAAKRYKK